MANNPKAFVSHASEDKDRFVLGFAHRLRAKGVDAWVDKWEMRPGDRLVDKVFDSGLKPADIAIVVLSRVSVTKPWVQKELNTAVVKSIEDRTRLIPVRLDGCAGPECLLDTIWEEIPDVYNYDREFDRIVNAIYGHYEKPPLGNIPGYVASPPVRIAGLNRQDATVLKAACAKVISAGSLYVVVDDILGGLSGAGLTENDLQDSLRILDTYGYIKGHESQVGIHLFEVQFQGMEAFARAVIPDYANIVRSVALQILNHKTESSVAIGEATAQPLVLVAHILTSFQNQGWVQMIEAQHDDIVIDVSPLLKRSFL